MRRRRRLAGLRVSQHAPPMTEATPDAAFAGLRDLIGTWKGTGRGNHPPIEAFRYREELTFREHGLEPLLHFEQRTWVVDEDGQEEPSHWESGFLRAVGEERVEMTNAQNGTRVEVMAGSLEVLADGTRHLTLESLLHGHDERVLQTSREFRWSENELHYAVAMATQNTPELTDHLKATLRRAPAPPGS